MAAFQFDPSQVLVVVVAPPFFQGQLEGFADGTFISVDRTREAYRLVAGIGKQITRVRQSKIDGIIEFQLEQAAMANFPFSMMTETDRILQTGIAAIAVKDRNSAIDLAFSAASWIRKMAPMTKGTAPSSVSWRFDCHSLTLSHGGLRQIGGSDFPPLSIPGVSNP